MARAHHIIKWSSFPTLPKPGDDQQDTVRLKIDDNVHPKEFIELVLQTTRKMWWKRMDAYGYNDRLLTYRETKDENQGPVSMVLRLDDIEELILAKAGLGGFYKGMYAIDNPVLREKAGSRVTFTWEKD